MQLQQTRKDADMAKEDRDRYQQREIDAKRDVHELRMQLDELENRRKLEFEEYRCARTALERENGVIREKTGHMEALRNKEAEQKTGRYPCWKRPNMHSTTKCTAHLFRSGELTS